MRFEYRIRDIRMPDAYTGGKPSHRSADRQGGSETGQRQNCRRRRDIIGRLFIVFRFVRFSAHFVVYFLNPHRLIKSQPALGFITYILLLWY